MTVAEHARALMAGATRVVGFTGAGISTESSVPDFRSEDGGLWTLHQTVTCTRRTTQSGGMHRRQNAAGPLEGARRPVQARTDRF